MKKFLDIGLPTDTKEIVLEKIIKYINSRDQFAHIVSINPEICVIAHRNEEFKDVVAKAQIKIIDGVGVALAARLLGIEVGPRITGVDLMEDLLTHTSKGRLGVVFLGGEGNLAKSIADCQSKLHPEASFTGIEGITDIKNPSRNEEENVLSIITDTKPHLLFVAFGSPYQELWIERNKHRLKGIVCMGVGGGFDFLSGNVPRAPRIIRVLGLEWLFRLIIEPWRWKRQLRLITFIWLVFKEKVRMSFK